MKLLFAFFVCLWLGESFAKEEQTKKTVSYSSDLSLKNKSVSSLKEKILFKPEIFPISHQNLLAKNTAFDPFIDYGEFQDDVTEEESINFFHYGRSLSMALAGGYEAVTFNIRQIYGDTAFVGVNATFFLDLRFAIQVSGVFPTGHYNSLFNTSFPFTHYGLDLKYYWNRQYLNKDKDFFSPYVIFGPFQLNIKSSVSSPSQTPTQNPTQNPEQTSPNQQNPQNPPTGYKPLSPLERKAIDSYNSAGIKIGFGFEFALIQQSFIGFEFSYLYTILQFENEDLSNNKAKFPPLGPTNSNQSLLQRLQFPNRPEVQGYRFYGDLMNIGLVFGINF